jgi:prevent-host-death family protein
MIQENMLDAKTKLSKLVEAAQRGEEVFIARKGVAVAKIVPVKKAKFNFGFLKDAIREIPDALLFAMSEEEAEQFIVGRKQL